MKFLIVILSKPNFTLIFFEIGLLTRYITENFRTCFTNWRKKFLIAKSHQKHLWWKKFRQVLNYQYIINRVREIQVRQVLWEKNKILNLLNWIIYSPIELRMIAKAKTRVTVMLFILTPWILPYQYRVWFCKIYTSFTISFDISNCYKDLEKDLCRKQFSFKYLSFLTLFA